MHVAWHLPRGAPTASELERRLESEAVGVYSLRTSPVHMLEPVSNADAIVLLGYPCLSEERIRAGVERIARVFGRRDPQAQHVEAAVSIQA